jgi:hypothetical protein
MTTLMRLFAVFVSTALFATPDVTGKWSGSLKDYSGHSWPCYLTLERDGNRLSGMMGSEERDQKPIDGTIEGSTLHFSVPAGDGSGTEFVAVELQWSDDELTGTLEYRDKKEQTQKLAVSLMRVTAK